MAIELLKCGDGVWTAPGARIIDRTARKRLPIGDDGFERAAVNSVLVDKTALISDVLDSGYTVTLFCRPRRFGKTLNMTMLKAFFESGPSGLADASLFEGAEIWEKDDGAYRSHFAAYPVIYLSMRTAKGDTWEQTYGALKDILAAEIERHSYLSESLAADPAAVELFDRMRTCAAGESDYAGSLLYLARLLRAYHDRPVVLLIDEYDAPVMAGYSAPGGGYYREVVTFLKRLFTGPLKDGGEVLAFACLTGVQRITKESIFSDLNNVTVSTALSTVSDERFGFTDTEMAALASYLGYADCMDEARRWYDGYRFGNVDVFNPWSALNYFNYDCAPDVYWGNTSGNSVVAGLVSRADEDTLGKIYTLMEPRGAVEAPLDLGIVFPDIGVRSDALWSMLYLAGYLTTEDTALPNNTRVHRRLRIPNAEVAELYRTEIVERFTGAAGGSSDLGVFHEALASGEAVALQRELAKILDGSISYFDITSENSIHMLVLGLCFGIKGFGDPVSNREAGDGRPDIQLVPERTPFFDGRRPLVTVELKHRKDASVEELEELAQDALGQIIEKRYDVGPLPELAHGRIRWGIACSGKRVAVAVQSVRC